MDFSSSVRFQFGFDKNRGFGSVSVSVRFWKKPPVRFGFFLQITLSIDPLRHTLGLCLIIDPAKQINASVTTTYVTKAVDW